MTFGRVVGGLSCPQVLERLADYIDGDVDASTKTAIEAHLRGCEECTRFGGEYAEVVKALRRELGADSEVAPQSAVHRLDRLFPPSGKG